MVQNNKIQKPFLKWIGGKTQIIDHIIKRIPTNMNNYHELFVGGGSVLFAVLSLQKANSITINGQIRVYDLNKSLINVYKDIQSNKDDLFEYITNYITEYDSISGTKVNRNPQSYDEAMESKESYYYWIRNKYNQTEHSVDRSAIFIFLNKTCFRGMYREGPHGFNVPYGHYKTTPVIMTKKDCDVFSELIKDVEFEHCGFDESIKNVVDGDFVYLDPPYAPEKTSSFVGYTTTGFDKNDHLKLFDEIKELHQKNIKFVMSNAKVDLVVKNFESFQSDDIIARRAINSKKPGSKTNEVLIYN